jgi:hypothetical protein
VAWDAAARALRGEDLDDAGEEGGIEVAEVVAAAIEELAGRGGEEKAEAGIDGYLEEGLGMAGEGDGAGLEDGPEGDCTLGDELARGFLEASEMDADGAELNGIAGIFTAENGGAVQLAAGGNGEGEDVERNFRAVVTGEAGGHVAVVMEEMALGIGERGRGKKGDVEARAGGVIEGLQRSQ